MAKILLAEDEEILRNLYVQVLKDAGLEAETVKDSEEAYTKALVGGYDLILLDIMMPKMDGISVLKKLKSNPPPIPNKKIT
ncbi:response regulator [Candidatus Gottesmanbacteria bacterium]|nr:response regulator [Candidatus Gottesmanbacteria bacterium]